MKDKLNKIKNKIPNFDDVKYIYFLSFVVFLVGLFLLAWFLFQSFNKDADNKFFEDVADTVDEIEEDCLFKRKIDGICVDLERYVDSGVIGVMIENNAEAWPLSGLSNASIVYEAPVEGNIPRYLAIYDSQVKLEKVGPVRSARPYYLDWISEYGNAMYMHVGGSPDSLEKIDNYNLFNINEMYRGWYFWRSSEREAPHNTYTSDKLWSKAMNDYGKYYEKEDYDSWVFSKEKSCEDDCVDFIKAKIAVWSSYHAVWHFNTSTQKYVRYQGNQKVFDESGEEINADTVVVQMVKSKIVDDIGRKEIETIGTGKVYVFRNGRVYEGEWKKLSRKDRTQWYDKDGNIIPLQAGKIWIEILPDNRELEF